MLRIGSFDFLWSSPEAPTNSSLSNSSLLEMSRSTAHVTAGLFSGNIGLFYRGWRALLQSSAKRERVHVGVGPFFEAFVSCIDVSFSGNTGLFGGRNGALFTEECETWACPRRCGPLFGSFDLLGTWPCPSFVRERKTNNSSIWGIRVGYVNVWLFCGNTGLFCGGGQGSFDVLGCVPDPPASQQEWGCRH